MVAVSFMTCATSCNDWLDLKPNNELVTDDYWKSKEDVQSVIMSGYRYMRDCVPTFIDWGELRGGIFISGSSSDAKLQDFNMTPTHSLCKYADVYKVINAANSVLKYAPDVCDIDDTYAETMMLSNLCEAYFMRAYCYLVLVKNYGSVPLILEPYVDDTESFDIAKSPETDIIAQIKADVKAALDTDAAKGTYEIDWETKGRATKWALYALMADAALWSEDYAVCKEYCNKILNATDSFRPVFIANGNQWYEMFYPGNSNEGIFELNWDKNSSENANNNFSSMWSQDATSTLRFTSMAVTMMQEEIAEVLGGTIPEGRVGRMLMASCQPSGGNSAYATATTYYMWKYYGNEIQDYTGGLRVNKDANFIIYRVSEVMMMLAQAETMTGNLSEALKLINTIRNRAGLGDYQGIDPDDASTVATLDERTVLEEILNQKAMEFIGEGKRWYDLLWYGRVANYKYRDSFVQMVVEGNDRSTNPSWITAVLADVNAWYLPLPQADIEHNSLLEQNPYYSTSK